jgi:hypothetical protein
MSMLGTAIANSCLRHQAVVLLRDQKARSCQCGWTDDCWISLKIEYPILQALRYAKA